LTERICGADSTKPALPIFEAKICFTPLDKCEDEEKLEGKPLSWIVDQGRTFGEKVFNGNKYKYGWSRDMANMARKRDQNDDILLDAFVMFPPAKDHPICQAPAPEVNCDPTQWSIEVPIGKYSVKVTFGDAEKMSGYELSVNGKTLIHGVKLKPN